MQYTWPDKINYECSSHGLYKKIKYNIKLPVKTLISLTINWTDEISQCSSQGQYKKIKYIIKLPVNNQAAEQLFHIKEAYLNNSTKV